MRVDFNQGKIRYILDDENTLDVKPGDDVSDLDPVLRKFATDYWTPEVIASYNLLIAKERADFSERYNTQPTAEQIYSNAIKKEPLAFALTLAINDGTLITGASVAIPVLGSILKAKL